MSTHKLICLIDNAPYHTSQFSRDYLKTLGLSVLYNAPEFPELNMCELFIREIKAKIRTLRGQKG